MSTELVKNSTDLLSTLCRPSFRDLSNAKVSTLNDSNSLLGAIIEAKSVLQTWKANLCTCSKQIQILPTLNNLSVHCFQLTTTSYRLRAHTCNEHTSISNTLLNLQIYGDQHNPMDLVTDFGYRSASWIAHHYWTVCASFECLSVIPSTTNTIFAGGTSKHNALHVLLENINSTSFQYHDQWLFYLFTKTFVLMTAFENLNPQKLNSCPIPFMKDNWRMSLSHSRATVGGIMILAQKKLRKILRTVSKNELCAMLQSHRIWWNVYADEKDFNVVKFCSILKGWVDKLQVKGREFMNDVIDDIQSGKRVDGDPYFMVAKFKMMDKEYATAKSYFIASICASRSYYKLTISMRYLSRLCKYHKEYAIALKLLKLVHKICCAHKDFIITKSFVLKEYPKKKKLIKKKLKKICCAYTRC
eukprot:345666_1